MAYFQGSQNKGELQELSEDLNHKNIDVKRDAVKRVIAFLTVGKDVSPLFQSVLKCLEHSEIEMKKLVYLYIISYSRTKPDDAIMAINAFRKDIHQGSPLVKALAVRTMGCLRVKKLNEYLIDPIKKALSDDDSYVRKTAVLCVPKIYEISPELIDQTNIIQQMQQMLKIENNAFVLANLIQSLLELSQWKGENQVIITKPILSRLLIAVNECIEWGQVFILECLANYVPINKLEAEMIVERITPRLSHNNSCVVLAGIKVLVKLLECDNDSQFFEKIQKKIGAPIATLISYAKPEVQYTILRNIYFIVEKYPKLLEKQIKSFFVKFTEPHYIKLEKLEIIVKLFSLSNYDQILTELKVYVNEADPQFVRKSIKAIEKICIKFEKSKETCMNILLKLNDSAKNTQSDIINQIVVSIEKIYRCYPEMIHYENSLEQISNNFAKLTESSADSAAIWIIGEYSAEISNALQLLEEKSYNFLQLERQVQLQLLTAAVKLFLINQNEANTELITNIFLASTNKCENADVRDRAYIYWRMLSTEPDLTKSVIFKLKPRFEENVNQFLKGKLSAMLDNLGKASTVFHLLPQELFPNEKSFQIKRTDTYEDEDKEKEEIAVRKEEQKKSEKKEPAPKNEVQMKNLLDFDMIGEEQEQKQEKKKQIDLLEIFDSDNIDQKKEQQERKESNDLI